MPIGPNGERRPANPRPRASAAALFALENATNLTCGNF